MSRPLRSHALSLPNGHPERANQWTHALGLVLSLIAAAVMLVCVSASGDVSRQCGCGIYAVAMVALYAASTLSHSFEDGPYREFCRMLDQVCIFLFIASCFTAFALTHLQNAFGYGILAVMWTIALTGAVIRMRNGSQTLPIALFIPLGWLPLLVMHRIYEVGHWQGLGLVLAGGLAYTGGFWFLANDHKRNWYHPAWHLSTIAGTALHYFFLLEFVARTHPIPGSLASR